MSVFLSPGKLELNGRQMNMWVKAERRLSNNIYSVTVYLLKVELRRAFGSEWIFWMIANPFVASSTYLAIDKT